MKVRSHLQLKSKDSDADDFKIHVNKSDTIKGYEALLETRLDETTRGGRILPKPWFVKPLTIDKSKGSLCHWRGSFRSRAKASKKA